MDSKGWTALVAAILEMVVVVVGQFYPQYLDFVKALIPSIAAVAGVLIAAFAYTQAAELRAGMTWKAFKGK